MVTEMKHGIVRKIDELGRIVIPAEYRKQLDINIKDDLEMSIQDNKICISKYHPNCVICGSKTSEKNLGGVKICNKCIAKIKDIT